MELVARSAQESFVLREEILGSAAAETAVARNNLACCFMDLNRPGEALAHLKLAAAVFYRVLRVRASAIAVLTVLQMAVNSDFDCSSFPHEVVTCKDLWTTIETHFGFLIMIPSTSVWVWCTFNELNLPTVKVLVE